MGHAHHTHGHGGHHHHGHAPPAEAFTRVFALGVALNLGYVLVEAGAGLWLHSLALLADAGHNLSDVAGLLIAWGGLKLAQRPPSRRFTFGLKRTPVLAALANGVLLVAACGAIAVESVQRFAQPVPVPGGLVMAVAGAGLLVNGLTAWAFARAGRDDVNMRGAFLHMAGDAAVSAALVLGGLVMRQTGWAWVDPVLGLAVAAIILKSTWGLLKESLALALDAVPAGIDPDAVAAWLAGLTGVAAVHDLHIWPHGSSGAILTAHLVMPAGHPGDKMLADVAHSLHHRFNIHHATLQVETDAAGCRQACGAG